MSSDNVLEFYDIPSKLPGIAWSPNTWKTRYCLNYKRIPYKTIWVEYPDIESLYKRLGAPPALIKRDGSPYYSLPLIRNPSTGTIVSDSTRIATYLDETYPDTPRLYPPGTKSLQAAFYYQFEYNLLENMTLFVLPKTAMILNPRSHEYFTESRSKMLGGELQELYPKGEKKLELWRGWKDEWSVVDGWMQGTEGFVMGDTISFADFDLAGWVIWCRCLFGEDSEEWKDIASWHGGRWGRLLEKLSEYETVA